MSTEVAMSINTNISVRTLLLFSLMLLGGCASIPTDLGRSNIDTLVRE